MSPTCPARPHSACLVTSLPTNPETGECAIQPGAPGCAATQNWSALSRSQASFLHSTSQPEHHAHQSNVLGEVLVIASVMVALLLLIYLVYYKYYGSKKAKASKIRRDYRKQRHKH